ncbi:MAG: bifunctional riboflavin kinase/FAD synthetase, partial [Nocardioidaceae bacterium]
MNFWRPIDGARTAWAGGPSVVTIGTFDGVHRGHQYVLGRARDLSESLGPGARLPVLAVTFDPHPMRVFAPDRAPVQVTSVGRRIELLKAAGADEVLVLAFDRQMAALTPQEFVERVLVDELHVAGVVVGENFRFGARAAGDVGFLRECSLRYGFSVVGLELEGAEQPWSSTYVRAAIADGDVAEAARALGRFHAVGGVVVEGDRRGREMGFPTANVPASTEVAVPADGVYAGWLRRLDVDGAPMPAAISVGTNPTFDGVERRVEAYVLDRDDLELYG